MTLTKMILNRTISDASIMNKAIRLLVSTFILLTCIQMATAAISDDVVAEIAGDYYDVYGSPELKANLACDKVFHRGDKAVLYVNIMNDGKITGFKANEKEISSDMKQYDAATIRTFMANEMLSDRAITTADSMRATLTPVGDVPVKIKLDTLLLGSLSAGRSLPAPAMFPIEIYDNAEAGTYTFKLEIAYRCQMDSAVVPPYGNVYYWYEDMNQTLYFDIVVEEEPYFKVVKTSSDLSAGDKEKITVTYANTGEQVAKECVARISVVDPFTTTDDHTYLGDINPGEEKEAIFVVKVGNDATPKAYSINSEVKYKDIHDKTKYSDNLKVIVDVGPAKSFSEKLNAPVIIGIVLVVVVAGVLVVRKKGRGDKDDNERAD